jgi:hypothetical protein
MQYVCKDPEDLAITMLVRVEGPRIGDLLYVFSSISVASLTVVDVQRKGDLVTLTLKGEDDGT